MVTGLISAQESAQFKQLLYALPKTEIHLHVEAVATAASIWRLMQKNALQYEGILSEEDLRGKFRVTNLNEFISVFINIIQNSFQSEEDFGELMQDAGAYLKANNIVYAELFFAPTKFLRSGLSFEKIIGILTAGAKRIREEHRIEVRYIIDVSRTFGAENAMSNLELALRYRSDAIIGIGLGGAEEAGPAREYGEVFKKAKANGFHVVAHAGEDMGPQAIWETLEYLNAERIGHGISAIQDKKLMIYLRERQIPLEVCPTSNLFTRKFVKELSGHPIRAFFNEGLFVTVNSDDPTLFSTSLVDEYMLLFNSGLFTKKEILKLIKNSVYATFLPQERKDALWQRTLSLWQL